MEAPLKKVNQFFWVLLPTFLYGIFWSFWSFALHKQVPVVDRFIWMGERAQRILIPNLPNPHDQLIYFTGASRWWDVALAPIGALVLVLLYYSKWMNDEDYAYEDVNFSFKKMFRNFMSPFLGPVVSKLREWREDRRRNARYKRLHQISTKKYMTDADHEEVQSILSEQRSSLDKMLEEMGARDRKWMGEDQMMGVRTWLAYGFCVSFFFGILSGVPAALSEGFGFYAIRAYLPALVGIFLIFTRRVQIATIGYLACWIGCWYGFSIGTGMVAGLEWTAIVYLPVGVFMILVYMFKSAKKKDLRDNAVAL